MKTLKEEHRELLKWRFERLDESKKLPNDGEGLDASQRCKQEKKDRAEYRRRLKELEAKHGATLEEVDYEDFRKFVQSRNLRQKNAGA